ncbi:PREDICTED: soyasaponin III rhamnosyltransferase-like [Prunus mume]|uniref:Soyasaponin III rhamnosyltransferase-like n=1 Tax=Prunus mume TaxID=102107 RepID=A0ABM1LQT8_PRUMU|nr:PREDICTED: soyasaponin III rhamnosyltransferase-like [Prunus mume]
MEFHSDDKAYEFYSEYAKEKGFAASKVSCRRSKTSGEWIGAKFACTRYGKKRKSDAINPRPCLKIDCKASLEVKRRVSNTKGAPKRVKNQNSNGKKYNKKPKKAQANLGLSNDGMESSLPRQEQARTRNDASDNYKDTHECLQQIVAYDHLQQPIKQFIGDQLPDWLILDFAPHWAVEIAQEYGVPLVFFSVLSAASMSILGLQEHLSGADNRNHVLPSQESLTSPQDWVAFSSFVAYREHEAVRVLKGLFEVNGSGVSDRIFRTCAIGLKSL